MIGKRWLTILMWLVVVSTVGAQTKTIELDFPTWQAEEPGAGEYWTELIKAFEAKNPGVKVKKTQVPFREYADKMTCASQRTIRRTSSIFRHATSSRSRARDGWRRSTSTARKPTSSRHTRG